MPTENKQKTIEKEAIEIAKDALQNAAKECYRQMDNLAEVAEYDLANAYRRAAQILVKLDTVVTIIYN